MNTYRALATGLLLAGLAGLPQAALATKSLATETALGAASGNVDATAQRAALIARIVEKWAAYAEELYNLDSSQWRATMDPLFAKATLESLQQAAEAKTYDAMDRAILAGNGAIAPQALGDTATDLVYVPIDPCRIFDTRVAGGIITAGTTRSFDVTAVSDYSFQGGHASNCNGAGAAGSFAAAAIIFTTVTPANIGYITAYPFGTIQPTSATMAYNAGTLASNQAIVKLDQGPSANELTVYSSAQTHLVGDIVGYFTTTVLPALDCIEMTSSSISINAGSFGTVSSPSCTTGYTITGGGCSMSNFDGRVVTTRTIVSGASQTHFCAFRNEGASSVDGTAYARCCKL